jgi:hypothetical protein
LGDTFRHGWFLSQEQEYYKLLTTGVGLFLCAPEDRGVLENSVEFLADDIEGIVEACMTTREAYGRLLNRLIWGTLWLQLFVLKGVDGKMLVGIDI